MKITYDPAKRAITLAERGLDFEDAPKVFAGKYFTYRDERRNYGEVRYVTAGKLDSRKVILVWTPRGDARHMISMRDAHEKEKKQYKIYLD